MRESKRLPVQVVEEGEQQWYWVKAVYKAVHLDVPRKRHLWEGTVFLVQAPANADKDDSASLQDKAERIARSKECEYTAAGGDRIHWTFS